ncbi:hypothetical protein Drorol1_Dr00010717 [Drosera rotundifolia]
MVVDRRSTTTSTPSHLAALRRLNLRAAASIPSTPSGTIARLPFTTDTLLANLRSAAVTLLPGLSDSILCRIEADLNFTFPPDLRSLLSSALPSGPRFPDWRSPRSYRHLIRLPLAAVGNHVARKSLWCKSWGKRPQDPETALRVVRARLRKSPVLVPVWGRCYVASGPCLAGNPVFYVDEDMVAVCALDLDDFFRREFSSSDDDSELLPDRVIGKKLYDDSCSLSSGNLCSDTDRSRRSLDTVASGHGVRRTRRTPRWIEFWSEVAAQSNQKRNSNSSSSASSSSSSSSYSYSSSPDRVLVCPARTRSPKWVEDYVKQIGLVLKQGGWYESDVSEIVEVPSAGLFDEEMIVVDNQVVLDALLLKADRFSDSLRRAGWSSEEVGEVFAFDVGVSEKERKGLVPPELSPEMIVRIQELVESVCKTKEKSVAS